MIRGEYDGKRGVVMEVVSNNDYSVVLRGGLIVSFKRNELKSLEN